MVKLRDMVFLVIFLSIFAQTSIISYTPVTNAIDLPDMDLLDETDMSTFVDTQLENVTARILSSYPLHTKLYGGGLFNISSTMIRMGTIDYNVFPMYEDGNYLHNANREWLDAYYSVANTVECYDFKVIGTLLDSYRHGFEIPNTFGSHYKMSSLLSHLKVLDSVNDSSEAVGEQLLSIEKFAPSKIDADEVIEPNKTYFDDWLLPEPKYRILSEALEDNLSISDTVGADQYTKESSQRLIAGAFDDAEEGILDVLRSNIASNLTIETGTYYIADDIEIVSYVFNGNANMTTYMTEKFVSYVREKADERIAEIEEEATVLTDIKYSFGLFSVTFTKHLPLKSFKYNLDLLGEIGGLINFGIQTVSAPLKPIVDAGAGIVDTIGSGFNTLVGTTGAVINNALAAPGNFVKNTAEGLGTFVEKTGNGIGNVVGKGTQLISDTVGHIASVPNNIAGAISNISKNLPLILAGVFAVGALGLLLYYLLVLKPKKDKAKEMAGQLMNQPQPQYQQPQYSNNPYRSSTYRDYDDYNKKW